MTTESRRLPVSPGAVVLRRATLALVAAVAVLVLVAAVLGADGATSTVLTVGLVTAFVLAFGSWSVHVVSALMPSASLLVALMTYLLQVVLLTAFLAVLRTSDEWGTEVRPNWLFATVATLVAVWTVAQVVLSARARIPLYDLPSRDREARR